jgi:hypothetical protein
MVLNSRVSNSDGRTRNGSSISSSVTKVRVTLVREEIDNPARFSNASFSILFF